MWSRASRAVGAEKKVQDTKDTQRTSGGEKSLMRKRMEAMAQGYKKVTENMGGRAQGDAGRRPKKESPGSPLSDDTREPMQPPSTSGGAKEIVVDSPSSSRATSPPLETPRSVLSPSRPVENEQLRFSSAAKLSQLSPESRSTTSESSSETDKPELQASLQTSHGSYTSTQSTPVKPARAFLSPDRSTAASRNRTLSPPASLRMTSPNRGYRGTPEKRAFARQQTLSQRDPGILKQRKNAIKDANDIQKQLDQALAALQAEKESHAQDVAERKKAEDDAQETFATAVIMLETLLAERDSVTSEAQHLTKELAETRAKAVAVSEKVQVDESAPMSPSRDPVLLEKKMEDLSHQLEEVTKEKNMIEQTAAGLKQQVAMHKAEIATLLQEKADIQLTADAARAETAEVCKQLKDAQLEAKRFKAAAASAAVLREKSEKLAAEVQKLQGQVTSVAEVAANENVKALRNEQTRHAEEIKEQYAKNERLSSELKAAKKRLSELEHEKKELTTELQMYQDGSIGDTLASQRAEMQDHEIELKLTKDVLEAVRKELADCQAQLGLGWSGATESGTGDDDVEHFGE